MDLKSVFELIERLESEAEGLESAILPASREAMLDSFVKGELNASDRKLVCGWMRSDPQLIARVAKAIKAQRKT